MAAYYYTMNSNNAVTFSNRILSVIVATIVGIVTASAMLTGNIFDLMHSDSCYENTGAFFFTIRPD